MMSWLGCGPLQIASHINIGHIFSVLAPYNEGHRHVSAPLHPYTAEARLVFSNSGQPLSGNHTMMSWLRL
jgi:hypothetical protein